MMDEKYLKSLNDELYELERMYVEIRFTGVKPNSHTEAVSNLKFKIREYKNQFMGTNYELLEPLKIK